MERYREAAPVVEHQLLQREIDLLEMKLVVEQPLTPKQEADLAAAVNGAIGYPFRIQFTYFEKRFRAAPAASSRNSSVCCRKTRPREQRSPRTQTAGLSLSSPAR